MRTVALLACGVLAMPAVAQETKPTTRPSPTNRISDIPAKMQDRNDAFDLWEHAREQVPIQVRFEGGAFVFMATDRPESAFQPPRSFSAKVPEADKALLSIQQQLQRARAAQNLKDTLRALDEIEREVMRARAALHKAQAKTSTKATPTKSRTSKQRN